MVSLKERPIRRKANCLSYLKTLKTNINFLTYSMGEDYIRSRK